MCNIYKGGLWSLVPSVYRLKSKHESIVDKKERKEEVHYDQFNLRSKLIHEASLLGHNDSSDVGPKEGMYTNALTKEGGEEEDEEGNAHMGTTHLEQPFTLFFPLIVSL